MKISNMSTINVNGHITNENMKYVKYECAINVKCSIAIILNDIIINQYQTSKIYEPNSCI